MLDELKAKAEGLMNNETVKNTINKAKDFIDSDKGKEMINNVKGKAEGFIHDHFGAKPTK